MVQVIIILIFSILSNKLFVKKSDLNYLFSQIISTISVILFFEIIQTSYDLYLIFILNLSVLLSLPIILTKSPTLSLISSLTNKSNITKKEIRKIIHDTENNNNKDSLIKLGLMNKNSELTLSGRIVKSILVFLKC
jgi:hypothetical protein